MDKKLAAQKASVLYESNGKSDFVAPASRRRFFARLDDD
jgi:hypothetical protein